MLRVGGVYARDHDEAHGSLSYLIDGGAFCLGFYVGKWNRHREPAESLGNNAFSGRLVNAANMEAAMLKILQHAPWLDVCYQDPEAAGIDTSCFLPFSGSKNEWLELADEERHFSSPMYKAQYTSIDQWINDKMSNRFKHLQGKYEKEANEYAKARIRVY